LEDMSRVGRHEWRHEWRHGWRCERKGGEKEEDWERRSMKRKGRCIGNIEGRGREGVEMVGRG